MSKNGLCGLHYVCCIYVAPLVVIGEDDRNISRKCSGKLCEHVVAQLGHMVNLDFL